MAKMQEKIRLYDGTTRMKLHACLRASGFTNPLRMSLYGRAVFDGVAALCDVGLPSIEPRSALAVRGVGFVVARTLEEAVGTSRDEVVLRG